MIDKPNSVYPFNRFEEEYHVERDKCNFRLVDLPRRTKITKHYFRSTLSEALFITDDIIADESLDNQRQLLESLLESTISDRHCNHYL